MKNVLKLSGIDLCKEGDRIYRELEPNSLDWTHADQISGKVIVIREIEKPKYVNFIELSERALTRQNSRFSIYRSQDPTFRQRDVEFWATEFARLYGCKIDD